MGIDVPILHFFLQFRSYIKGDTLTLGRQCFYILDDHFNSGRSLLKDYYPDTNLDSFFQEPNSSGDIFFKLIGANTIQSIDYSDYEGASIVHDMNMPVPSELHNRFDTIIDSGTTEHIFDVKTVTENIKAMLKEQGVYITISPANNFYGHGFYQFSPEFYRTVFSESNGYRIENYFLGEFTYEKYSFNVLPEPAPGQRQEIKTSPNPCYNGVIIRKLSSIDSDNYQQSDYVDIWQKAKE